MQIPLVGLILALAAVTAPAPPPGSGFEARFTGRTLRCDYFHGGIAKKEHVSLDKLRLEGEWPGSRLHLQDDTNLGKYSSKGTLLEMTPYFTDAEVHEFLPALWDATKYQGRVYGVPHQTDTTAIVYDKDVVKGAGITSVPHTLDNAWTWEEFGQVATKLRANLSATACPSWTCSSAAPRAAVAALSSAAISFCSRLCSSRIAPRRW